jgi:hypothetical protein
MDIAISSNPSNKRPSTLAERSGQADTFPLLHMWLQANPEQKWADLRQVVMDQLRNENEALMRRLKRIEESGTHVAADGHGVGLCQGRAGSW